jgi:hypothetical protein
MESPFIHKFVINKFPGGCIRCSVVVITLLWRMGINLTPCCLSTPLFHRVKRALFASYVNPNPKGIPLHILVLLDAMWRWVVGFTFRLLYSLGKYLTISNGCGHWRREKSLVLARNQAPNDSSRLRPSYGVLTLSCTFSFVFFCCVFSLVLWFLCACLPACLACRKTQMKTCKKGQQKQRSRFLQEYKSKTSYTPEDGHVDRNI